MNCAFVLAALVPLLPLLAAGGIAVFVLAGAQGDDAEPPTARLAEASAWCALLLLLGLDLLAVREGTPGEIVLGTWYASGKFVVPLSFILDPLSLSIATLVALIGGVSLRFSRTYLHREAGFHRFFMLMALFLAGMLLNVLAGNSVLSFVGWEFCGLSSFLLIGYDRERPTATGNALYAFLTNRIGDAGFMLGIALAAVWLGSVEWSVLAAWSGDAAGFDKVRARVLLFGFLLAALAKSAQLPLSAWLARALEGPTPSSAVFYGAVMVHAGVYLVLRLAPLLAGMPGAMVCLALVGATTALYGWLAGLVQTDVKSSLIFATTTQVGLMFLACGLGWFELAAWHLCLHAAWRAWQFLLAPSYMHLVSAKAQAVPAWLANRQWLYTASLQRFWLDHLANAALVRPVLAFGRDMRDLDDHVMARLIGMPVRRFDSADGRSGGTQGDDVIRGHGLAGRLLLWVAERCHDFEQMLLLRRGDGPLKRALKSAGVQLQVLESLLEQPRYLLLAILATFVVIL